MHFPGLQVKGLQAAIGRKTLHVHGQLHHTTGTAGKSCSVTNPLQTQKCKGIIHWDEFNANGPCGFTGSVQFFLITETVCTMQPHPFFGSMWTEEAFDAT